MRDPMKRVPRDREPRWENVAEGSLGAGPPIKANYEPNFRFSGVKAEIFTENK